MKKIIFMGTPDFSVPILQALVESKEYEVILVVTQPDRPKGRKKVLTPPPVKVEAEKQKIPVFQPEKLKNDFTRITELKPDLIVTAAYGQLLPNEVLEAPKHGCINVHASLLPELRGGAPIHYAILQGKKVTGITILYMVEKLDAGDMLAKKEIAITDTDNVGTMHDKLSIAGAELLIDTLPKLFAGQVVHEKQDENLATFAANIKRDQEKIDWNKSNVEVYNHIRGLNPWPVAFTTYLGQNMKIWRGEIDNTEYSGVPGEIVRITDTDAFVVQCGNHQGIRITEIQPAGKKRMTVKDFLRGAKDQIKLGTKMGE